jgi:hypothetical protein
MDGLFDACPLGRKVTLKAPMPAARAVLDAGGDVLADLSVTDRRLINKMSADAGVAPAALLPEIVAAYLRLLRDVPAALPRDPMRGLAAGAARRAR